MKIKKVAVCAVITTGLCLAYVNQQIEIVKISYSLRDKEKRISDSIDQNRVLLYNNTSLKAPQYLSGMLKENELDLVLPEPSAVAKVRVVRHDQIKLAKTATQGWKNQILDLFVPKAQAASGLRR